MYGPDRFNGCCLDNNTAADRGLQRWRNMKRLSVYLMLTVFIAALFALSIVWRPALYGVSALALLLAAIAAIDLLRH